ncbi:Sphingoid long-chain bases kinase 1 [Zea mays]|nr:Sphingoid long-chain bases kinase 1 [Zea mays]
MQKSDHHEQKLTSPRGLIHKILRRTNSRRSPTAADQQPSPVSPETSNSSIFSKQKDVDDAIKDSEKLSTHTIRIEDEKSDLLGSEIYSGKLTLDNKTKSSSNEQSGSGSSSNCFDARLSTEALIWGSNILKLEDIVSFDAMFDPYVKCQSPPKILVILNPRSGHGSAQQDFLAMSPLRLGICLSTFIRVGIMNRDLLQIMIDFVFGNEEQPDKDGNGNEVEGKMDYDGD